MEKTLRYCDKCEVEVKHYTNFLINHREQTEMMHTAQFKTKNIDLCMECTKEFYDFLPKQLSKKELDKDVTE